MRFVGRYALALALVPQVLTTVPERMARPRGPVRRLVAALSFAASAALLLPQGIVASERVSISGKVIWTSTTGPRFVRPLFNTPVRVILSNGQEASAMTDIEGRLSSLASQATRRQSRSRH
jgi:hypothetical protein